MLEDTGNVGRGLRIILSSETGLKDIFKQVNIIYLIGHWVNFSGKIFKSLIFWSYERLERLLCPEIIN